MWVAKEWQNVRRSPLAVVMVPDESNKDTSGLNLQVGRLVSNTIPGVDIWIPSDGT
jgi:hypothetical protein